MSNLLDSCQATSPHPLDEASLRTLRMVLTKEKDTLLCTAARISSNLTGVLQRDASKDSASLRLASLFHQMLHPPLRHHNEYHASSVNTSSAAWPVSGEFAVPLASVQASGGMLMSREIMPREAQRKKDEEMGEGGRREGGEGLEEGLEGAAGSWPGSLQQAKRARVKQDLAVFQDEE